MMTHPKATRGKPSQVACCVLLLVGASHLGGCGGNDKAYYLPETSRGGTRTSVDKLHGTYDPTATAGSTGASYIQSTTATSQQGGQSIGGAGGSTSSPTSGGNAPDPQPTTITAGGATGVGTTAVPQGSTIPIAGGSSNNDTPGSGCTIQGNHGGQPNACVTTGGAPTGGAPTGGAPTGGAPTGGAPTGGAPTGGAPTGGTHATCIPACAGGNASWACVSAKCEVVACHDGFRDCDGSSPDCDRDVRSDAQNCGKCGKVCPSNVCRAETCCQATYKGNTGVGIGHVNFPSGYLAALRVKNDVASVLAGIGIVVDAGTQPNSMYVGVYQDANNSPGARIAGGQEPVSVGAGGVVTTVPQSDLLTGNYYWILIAPERNVSLAYNSAAIRTGNFLATSYAFAPLPNTAPPAMAIANNSPDPNMYLVVGQCGT